MLTTIIESWSGMHRAYLTDDEGVVVVNLYCLIPARKHVGSWRLDAPWHHARDRMFDLVWRLPDPIPRHVYYPELGRVVDREK